MDFMSTTSTTRCLVATVAFGMGLDVPDIDMVVHWGCSSSIVHYWQEVGRCRRDGKAGKAILYAHRRSFGPKTEKSFVQLCQQINSNDVQCIRHEILHFLTFKPDVIRPMKSQNRATPQFLGCTRCACCRLCANRCSCDSRY